MHKKLKDLHHSGLEYKPKINSNQNNVITDSIPRQLKCKNTFFQTSPQPSPFEGEGEKQTFPSLVGERGRVRVKTFSFQLSTFNSK
ncbi:MAG: hypothetical protein LBQ59_01335 [Candidatus Peribacteria bacterium]|jgi:hypothetical protein|nr:hypothetical protein [Candidatus Peribacteria bacterium]